MKSRLTILVLCLSALFPGMLMMTTATASARPLPAPLAVQVQERTDVPPRYKEVKDAGFVSRLYQRLKSLPPKKPGTVCPLLAGARYELTFWWKNGDALTATADRGGCGTVSLNEKDVRLADKGFWAQVDKALQNPDQPTSLMIKSTQVTNQPSATKTVWDAHLVRRLQDHISHLPVPAGDLVCTQMAGPKYELIFFVNATELWRVEADRGGCRIVSFNDGEERLTDATFWKVLDKALRVGR